MSTEKIYTIELLCDFTERWRYNIELQTTGYNEKGERIGYTDLSSHIAEATADLKQPPKGIEIPRNLSLTTCPCFSAEVMIFVVPHALPEENFIERTKPIECPLIIRCADREIRRETIRINPWGGASVRLKINE